MRFRLGFRPRLCWGAYSAPPDLIAGFQGLVLRERGERGKGKGKEEKGEEPSLPIKYRSGTRVKYTVQTLNVVSGVCEWSGETKFPINAQLHVQNSRSQLRPPLRFRSRRFSVRSAPLFRPAHAPHTCSAYNNNNNNNNNDFPC